LREITRHADLLVAADSGLVAAEEAGLKPDWIVGDMDSLAGNISNGNTTPIENSASLRGLERLAKYPPEKVIHYPHDKDFSDTELAIALLEEKGCAEIWLAGGGGRVEAAGRNRIDHVFAICSLFERENPPARWFTSNEEIRCLKEGKTLSMTLPSGSLVSLFPLGAGPWAAESSGLKWPLDGLAWERGRFSLSNAAETGPFEIRSKKGRFLAVFAILPF
jgi:thiamine pyrophosphokinase